jgi:propionate CoA-transferase
MDFEPVIDAPPRRMDERIFRPDAMALRAELTSLALAERFRFHPEQGVFYVDFSRLRVKRAEDVVAIFDEADRQLAPLGRKVPAVVNYDDFELDDELMDLWADQVARVADAHYTTVVRYAANAFVRAGLAHTLAEHGLKPNMYASAASAQSHLPERD